MVVLWGGSNCLPVTAPVFTLGFCWGPVCSSSFFIFYVVFFVLFVFVFSLVYPMFLRINYYWLPLQFPLTFSYIDSDCNIVIWFMILFFNQATTSCKSGKSVLIFRSYKMNHRKPYYLIFHVNYVVYYLINLCSLFFRR